MSEGAQGRQLGIRNWERGTTKGTKGAKEIRLPCFASRGFARHSAGTGVNGGGTFLSPAMPFEWGTGMSPLRFFFPLPSSLFPLGASAPLCALCGLCGYSLFIPNS